MRKVTLLLGLALFSCPVRADQSAPTTQPALVRAPMAPTETVLGRLAASMKPGTFALLNREGDGSGYERASGARTNGYGGVGTAYAYAQKAVYDPVRDRILYHGAPHDGTNGSYITYDVATNRWNSVPLPRNVPDTHGFLGHSYDLNALNPSARMFYATARQGNTVARRFNADTDEFVPGMAFTPAQKREIPNPLGSWEYFPDRDELVAVWGANVFAYRHKSNDWIKLHAGKWTGLASSSLARYSKAGRCVLLFGGANQIATGPGRFRRNSSMYRYNADGGPPVRLADLPGHVLVRENNSIWWVDPPSGNLLGIYAVQADQDQDAPTGARWTGEYEFWEYDIRSDAWKKLDASVIPPPSQWMYSNVGEQGIFATLAVPLERHGVAAVMSAARGNRKSSVYLYRHSLPPPRGAPAGDSK